MKSKHCNKAENSFWMGIIIITIGVFLLFNALDLELLPDWLVSWKTLLIAIGIGIGFRRNFEGIAWVILIVIGTFFMIEDIPGIEFEVRKYIFPILIITVGILILFRARLYQPKRNDLLDEKKNDLINPEANQEVMNLTSFFGSSKRRIFSKNFGGGQITSILGGSEVDFTQADIDGNVIIDVVSIFGGNKFLVPSNWEVKSNITCIFGSVEDKRKDSSNYSSNKKLILTGAIIFGGVDIKNY